MKMHCNDGFRFLPANAALRLLLRVVGSIGLVLHCLMCSACRSGVKVGENVELIGPSEQKLTIKLGSEWIIAELGLALVPIAPGTFLMGGETGMHEQSHVTLTDAFWLGRTEVTQHQWKMIMKGNPSHFRGDAHPVEQITWKEAMEFCRVLNQQESNAGRLPRGYVFGLPTEAQWEYACRAGTDASYSGELSKFGWYDQNSANSTHAVALKHANPWGLFDMHGNVSEWCLDGHGKLPVGNVTNPRGPFWWSPFRVVRGGNWASSALACRSMSRSWNGPDYRNHSTGFRLALAKER